jgi:hypothetical protein
VVVKQSSATPATPLQHQKREVLHKPSPAAEEAHAVELLGEAKRARRQAGRQPVADWPWQVPKRPIPQPVVDIVAAAKAELAKEENGDGSP